MKLKGACPKCAIRHPVGSPSLHVRLIDGSVVVEKRDYGTGICDGYWEVGAVPTPRKFVKNYRKRPEVARFRSKQHARQAIKAANLRVLEATNRMPDDGCRVHNRLVQQAD